MLNIKSVHIKKYKGEPALFTKPSLLICTCLETVILVACAQSNFPTQASSVRSPLTGNAHALGTRLDLTSFLLMTLQQQPSSQDTGYFVNSAST